MKPLFKINFEVTIGRLVVALGSIALLVAIINWVLPQHIKDDVWNWLTKTQNGASVLGAGVAVAAGIVSAFLYDLKKREVWRQDVDEMKEKIGEIDKSLSDQLAALREDHDALLREMAPAIGGAFTQSLFQYHPMVSKEIASILSKQTNEQYGKHHRRVIVQSANDNYTVMGLRRHGASVVWELDNHPSWSWCNDSKVTKFPLSDFLLVAAATPGALDRLLDQIPNIAQRKADFERRAEFLGGNVATTIVVNPADPNEPIDENDLDTIFAFREVAVGGKRVNAAKLERIAEESVPVGVYAAWSLPASDLDLHLPLHVNDTLTVEYSAHFSLAAQMDADGTCWGEMLFSPSDVISSEYELTLMCPSEVEFEGGQFKIEPVQERSGCRLVHGPLGNLANIKKTSKSTRAVIKVLGPLTDMHQFSLTWKGEPKTKAPQQGKNEQAAKELTGSLQHA